MLDICYNLYRDWFIQFSQYIHDGDTLVIPILQMRSKKLRKVNQFA